MPQRTPVEEFLYNDLLWIKKEYVQQGLTSACSILERFLSKVDLGGDWDHALYCSFLEEFRLENGRRNPAYIDGITQLDELFKAASSLNPSFNPFELWSDPINHIREPSILGIIYRLIEQEQETKERFLLIGYAHLIQYETRGDFAEERIGLWTNAAVDGSDAPTRARKIAQEKQRFLTILRVGCQDDRSDMYHLRNAFAHAHFQFVGDDTILIWDELNGVRNYETILGLGDLFNITSIFRNKLLLCEVFPRLWVYEKSLRPSP